jgi:hypothetical protein
LGYERGSCPAKVDTLGAIYERGLIRRYLDWLAQLLLKLVLIEPFITY